MHKVSLFIFSYIGQNLNKLQQLFLMLNSGEETVTKSFGKYTLNIVQILINIIFVSRYFNINQECPIIVECLYL